MHRLLRATALVMIVIAAAAVELAAQGADPLVGTWVLNVAKSKYTPGPAPKSETRTYVVAGPDIEASSKGVVVPGSQQPHRGLSTTMAKIIQKLGIQTRICSR